MDCFTFPMSRHEDSLSLFTALSAVKRAFNVRVYCEFNSLLNPYQSPPLLWVIFGINYPVKPACFAILGLRQIPLFSPFFACCKSIYLENPLLNRPVALCIMHPVFSLSNKLLLFKLVQ
jgi:hypothetical protein